MEANVTVDILNPVQPYAAFATTIFDADQQFLVRVNELNRYLVYAR